MCANLAAPATERRSGTSLSQTVHAKGVHERGWKWTFLVLFAFGPRFRPAVYVEKLCYLTLQRLRLR